MRKHVIWTLSALAIFAGADSVYAQVEWNREYYGTFHMLNHNHYPTEIELTSRSIPNVDYPISNISDSAGNVLFYTRRFGHSGRAVTSARIPYVWNSLHQIVRGSEGALGSLSSLPGYLNYPAYDKEFDWENSSSVFLPAPYKKGKFFVINIAGYDNDRFWKLPYRAAYPIPRHEAVLTAGVIDAQANAGKGQFELRPQQILGYGFGSFGVIRQPETENFFLIASNWRTDSIYAFGIDSNGFYLADQFARPFKFYDRLNFLFDLLKVSPDGNWIVQYGDYAKNYPDIAVLNHLLLWRFDPVVGRFQNHSLVKITLPASYRSGHLPMEFSPDSRSLFVQSHNGLNAEIVRLELGKLPSDNSLVIADSLPRCLSLNQQVFKTFGTDLRMGADGCFYINGIWTAPTHAPLLRILNPSDPDSEWIFDTLIPPMPFTHKDTIPGSGSFFNNSGYWPIRVATGNIRRLVWSKPLKTPCLGEPMTFGFQNGYRADSVRWNFGDGTIVTATGNDVVHRFTDTGLLEVSAIFFGKRLRDTLRRSIRVNYIRRPQLGADTLLCAGSSLLLDAADASVQHYRWSHGQQSASTRIDTAGTYILEVENQHCIARDTLVVGMLSCNILQSGFCVGDSSRVSINGLQPDSFKLWANGNAVSVRNREAAMLLDTGLHQLVLEQHASGLSRRFAFQHRIHPLPMVQLGRDTLLCMGRRFVLQATRNLQDYLWSNGSTANFIEISDSGNYHLRASDGRCFNSDTIKVIGIDCRMSVEGHCLDDISFISLGQTADSARISFGDGNAMHTPLPVVAAHRYLQEGNYGLQVDWYRSGLQTSSRRNISITAVWEPFLSDSLAVCRNATLEPEQLTSGARYQWNTGSAARNIRITEAGVYTLVVQKGMCRTRDTVKISLLDCQCRLFMPNTFTPNMNGLNEWLAPTFDCVPAEYHLIVYNRWGQRIFDNERRSAAWNGFYRGEQVQDGVYVWQLHFTDPLSGQFRSEKGTVLVLR